MNHTERASVNNNKQKNGVLASVRILDMATVLAAPLSASLCADLGAEVIKLELPDGSDALRSLAPVKDKHALHWKVSNRGKLGITLDVRKPEGRELFLNMLPQFDVLVENFRTGTMDRWGLDIKTLHQANPNLTVLRLTGFGQTGPYANRPGFARIFEAMSGLAHLTGEQDGPPQHMNFSLGDAIAGLFGAFSIAAAMVEQRATPDTKGREIDLSATEAILRLLETLPVEHELLGKSRQRTGSRATYSAPSNVYQTADGIWVTVVASSNPIFRRLCDAMGSPELLDAPNMQTNTERIKHSKELDEIVKSWCNTLTFHNLATALEQNNVPFSKVYDTADVLADPHFLSRNAIIRLLDPDFGSIPAPCVVPRFSGHNPSPISSGPNVGANNAEVFASLGLTEEETTRLHKLGVI